MPDSHQDQGESPGVLHFRDGIPGFPGVERFALSDLDESGTFQVLSCLDDESLSMVVCTPWLLFPDYAADLREQDREDLGLDAAEDAVVFCGVTLDTEERAFHVNLLGPFVVNARTNQGRQIVLAESGYKARETVRLDDMKA